MKHIVLPTTSHSEFPPKRIGITEEEFQKRCVVVKDILNGFIDDMVEMGMKLHIKVGENDDVELFVVDKNNNIFAKTKVRILNDVER